MLKVPSIFSPRTDNKDCAFYLNIPTGEIKINRSDIFLNVPASTDPPPDNWRNYPEYERGWIAVRRTLKQDWYTLDGIAYIEGRTIVVRATTEDGCDAIALGLDQRLKREDVQDATIIYKENDKWLFAHATVEEHHDRILLAETAISTVFEGLLMDRIVRMDVIDIAGRSTSNRRGELTILEHITDFRDDCMKLARWNEGQLHIGEHVKNPEEHYIYKMVEKAYDLAIKKWTAEKPRELNQISNHLKPIGKRLKSRHSFKRRWEIPTVFPNAERTETQTETETESS